MVNLEQGDVWWADMPEPSGSEPGYRRPVVIVLCNELIQSKIRTVVCVPLTSNLNWANFPGCVTLSEDETGLPQNSVANTAQISTIDTSILTERVGNLSNKKLEEVLDGIEIVIGRRISNAR
jgi:mRNA interferase MazF